MMKTDQRVEVSRHDLEILINRLRSAEAEGLILYYGTLMALERIERDLKKQGEAA